MWNNSHNHSLVPVSRLTFWFGNEPCNMSYMWVCHYLCNYFICNKMYKNQRNIYINYFSVPVFFGRHLKVHQYYRRPAVFITHVNAHMHVLHPPKTHMCFTARTNRMRTRHSNTAALQPNPVLSHCHVSRIQNSSDSPSWPVFFLAWKAASLDIDPVLSCLGMAPAWPCRGQKNTTKESEGKQARDSQIQEAAGI